MRNFPIRPEIDWKLHVRCAIFPSRWWVTCGVAANAETCFQLVINSFWGDRVPGIWCSTLSTRETTATVNGGGLKQWTPFRPRHSTCTLAACILATVSCIRNMHRPPVEWPICFNQATRKATLTVERATYIYFAAPACACEIFRFQIISMLIALIQEYCCTAK